MTLRCRILLVVLSALLSQGCYTDGAARVEAPTRRVTCLAQGYAIENLCEDEKQYLDWAASAYPEWKLADLTAERLQDVVKQTRDVDKAAALFYQRLVADPENRRFREELARREGQVKAGAVPRLQRRVLLALAPGMFYADNQTAIDATGKSLRDVALALGMTETVIPTESTGTVERNGGLICRFIEDVERKNKADSVILASASKGSSDVRMAMRYCGQASYFHIVSGWVNMGGILRGSHLVDGVLRDGMSRWKARFYFWMQGYDWEGLRSLRHAPDGPLAAEVPIPGGVKVVNVVGVPLFRHVTARARPFFLFLVPQGPSDGMVLLAESYVPGTPVYASFRNDHYFQWPIPEERIKGLLLYLLDPPPQGVSRR